MRLLAALALAAAASAQVLFLEPPAGAFDEPADALVHALALDAQVWADVDGVETPAALAGDTLALTVPAAAAAGEATVTLHWASGANDSAVFRRRPAPPAVTHVWPAVAAPGDVVRVSGGDFASLTAGGVALNVSQGAFVAPETRVPLSGLAADGVAQAAPFEVRPSGQYLSFVAPTNGSAGDVVVARAENPRRLFTLAAPEQSAWVNVTGDLGFWWTYDDAPAVLGYHDGVVDVARADCSAATVDVGAVAAAYASRVVLSLAEGQQTVQLTCGPDVFALDLNVSSAPATAVHEVIPAEGSTAGGDVVTVRASNHLGAVDLNGVAATVLAVDGDLLTVRTPALPAGPVAVNGAEGLFWAYADDEPRIAALDGAPPRATGGSALDVTLSEGGDAPVASASLDGRAAKVERTAGTTGARLRLPAVPAGRRRLDVGDASMWIDVWPAVADAVTFDSVERTGRTSAALVVRGLDAPVETSVGNVTAVAAIDAATTSVELAVRADDAGEALLNGAAFWLDAYAYADASVVYAVPRRDWAAGGTTVAVLFADDFDLSAGSVSSVHFDSTLASPVTTTVSGQLMTVLTPTWAFGSAVIDVTVVAGSQTATFDFEFVALPVAPATPTPAAVSAPDVAVYLADFYVSSAAALIVEVDGAAVSVSDAVVKDVSTDGASVSFTLPDSLAAGDMRTLDIYPSDRPANVATLALNVSPSPAVASAQLGSGGVLRAAVERWAGVTDSGWTADGASVLAVSVLDSETAALTLQVESWPVTVSHGGVTLSLGSLAVARADPASGSPLGGDVVTLLGLPAALAAVTIGGANATVLADNTVRTPAGDAGSGGGVAALADGSTVEFQFVYDAAQPAVVYVTAADQLAVSGMPPIDDVGDVMVQLDLQPVRVLSVHSNGRTMTVDLDTGSDEGTLRVWHVDAPAAVAALALPYAVVDSLILELPDFPQLPTVRALFDDDLAAGFSILSSSPELTVLELEPPASGAGTVELTVTVHDAMDEVETHTFGYTFPSSYTSASEQYALPRDNGTVVVSGLAHTDGLAVLFDDEFGEIRAVTWTSDTAAELIVAAPAADATARVFSLRDGVAAAASCAYNVPGVGDGGVEVLGGASAPGSVVRLAVPNDTVGDVWFGYAPADVQELWPLASGDMLVSVVAPEHPSGAVEGLVEGVGAFSFTFAPGEPRLAAVYPSTVAAGDALFVRGVNVGTAIDTVTVGGVLCAITAAEQTLRDGELVSDLWLELPSVGVPVGEQAVLVSSSTLSAEGAVTVSPSPSPLSDAAEEDVVTLDFVRSPELLLRTTAAGELLEVDLPPLPWSPYYDEVYVPPEAATEEVELRPTSGPPGTSVAVVYDGWVVDPPATVSVQGVDVPVTAAHRDRIFFTVPDSAAAGDELTVAGSSSAGFTTTSGSWAVEAAFPGGLLMRGSNASALGDVTVVVDGHTAITRRVGRVVRFDLPSSVTSGEGTVTEVGGHSAAFSIDFDAPEAWVLPATASVLGGDVVVVSVRDGSLGSLFTFDFCNVSVDAVSDAGGIAVDHWDADLVVLSLTLPACAAEGRQTLTVVGDEGSAAFNVTVQRPAASVTAVSGLEVSAYVHGVARPVSVRCGLFNATVTAVGADSVSFTVPAAGAEYACVVNDEWPLTVEVPSTDVGYVWPPRLGLSGGWVSVPAVDVDLVPDGLPRTEDGRVLLPATDIVGEGSLGVWFELESPEMVSASDDGVFVVRFAADDSVVDERGVQWPVVDVTALRDNATRITAVAPAGSAGVLRVTAGGAEATLVIGPGGGTPFAASATDVLSVTREGFVVPQGGVVDFVADVPAEMSVMSGASAATTTSVTTFNADYASATRSWSNGSTEWVDGVDALLPGDDGLRPFPNTPLPRALIHAVTPLGACDDLVVSARHSTGARLSFQWGCTNDAALDAELAGQPTVTAFSTLEILQGDFEISLTVTDVLGRSATTTTTIHRSPAHPLSVAFNVPAAGVELRADETLELVATAAFSGCAAATPALSYSPARTQMLSGAALGVGAHELSVAVTAADDAATSAAATVTITVVPVWPELELSTSALPTDDSVFRWWCSECSDDPAEGEQFEVTAVAVDDEWRAVVDSAAVTINASAPEIAGERRLVAGRDAVFTSSAPGAWTLDGVELGVHGDRLLLSGPQLHAGATHVLGVDGATRTVTVMRPPSAGVCEVLLDAIDCHGWHSSVGGLLAFSFWDGASPLRAAGPNGALPLRGVGGVVTVRVEDRLGNAAAVDVAVPGAASEVGLGELTLAIASGDGAAASAAVRDLAGSDELTADGAAYLLAVLQDLDDVMGAVTALSERLDVVDADALAALALGVNATADTADAFALVGERLGVEELRLAAAVAARPYTETLLGEGSLAVTAGEAGPLELGAFALNVSAETTLVAWSSDGVVGLAMSEPLVGVVAVSFSLSSVSDPVCVSREDPSDSWSTEGVSLFSADPVVCHSTHLSEFTVQAGGSGTGSGDGVEEDAADDDDGPGISGGPAAGLFFFALSLSLMCYGAFSSSGRRSSSSSSSVGRAKVYVAPAPPPVVAVSEKTSSSEEVEMEVEAEEEKEEAPPSSGPPSTPPEPEPQPQPSPGPPSTVPASGPIAVADSHADGTPRSERAIRRAKKKLMPEGGPTMEHLDPSMLG